MIQYLKLKYKRFFKKVKKWFVYRILKKPYYNDIDTSLLMLNFFVQRFFRYNSHVPFSVHFTSDVGGIENIKMLGDPKEMIISFAASGGCYYSIHADTTLEIDENTLWAHGVTFTTGNHGLLDRNAYTKGNIKIGKNCWIGSNACILAGAELGDNVTVAANAVVNKSFPSNCLIGGIPAKIIKTF